MNGSLCETAQYIEVFEVGKTRLESTIMWKFVILAAALHSTRGLPLEEKPTDAQTTDKIEQLHRTVAAVSYIQNFKNIMADYVSTQYRNLTVNDMEKIKQTLEEFLVDFANDLRQTVESRRNVTFEAREKIQDGVPDATYEEIKNRMRNEFPDIEDDTADEIVFKLRKNLFVTRRKIDSIVNDSEKAEAEYALE